MSALNRVACPHCGGEVLILRGAATRRWVCCHCEAIIHLDALEGGPAGEHAGPDAVEWEPLPIAHAAPPKASNLGPASAAADVMGTPAGLPPGAGGRARGLAAKRTDRECAMDQAARRHAQLKAARRSRWINALASGLLVLAVVMLFYPGRLDEDAFLPPLNAYFQRITIIFPYFFFSPRWYLVVLLAIAAHGVYYGRSWGVMAGFAALAGVCIAFNLHWAPVACCAMLAPMLWMVRHFAPRAREPLAEQARARE